MRAGSAFMMNEYTHELASAPADGWFQTRRPLAYTLESNVGPGLTGHFMMYMMTFGHMMCAFVPLSGAALFALFVEPNTAHSFQGVQAIA